MGKFDDTFKEIITECKTKDVINEGFIGDFFGGAALGGAATAATATLIGAAAGACLPATAAAGAIIGLPIGAVIGTGLWLKHLIGDKIAKKEDESEIKELLKKLNDKSFEMRDFERVEKLKNDYKDDLKNVSEWKPSDENKSVLDGTDADDFELRASAGAEAAEQDDATEQDDAE